MKASKLKFYGYYILILFILLVQFGCGADDPKYYNKIHFSDSIEQVEDSIRCFLKLWENLPEGFKSFQLRGDTLYFKSNEIAYIKNKLYNKKLSRLNRSEVKKFYSLMRYFSENNIDLIMSSPTIEVAFMYYYKHWDSVYYPELEYSRSIFLLKNENQIKTIKNEEYPFERKILDIKDSLILCTYR